MMIGNAQVKEILAPIFYGKIFSEFGNVQSVVSSDRHMDHVFDLHTADSIFMPDGEIFCKPSSVRAGGAR
ncbi:hypothetical protein OO184_19315 [Photorhabdus sp. APURE]|uniref:hypothetical protein n=1 Tax=Photorhabdus aballayi TaxID=2991723 RepID=UPI00223C8C6E|nr:hypothetical protein [Photorhabdus aballayi]MCW7550020.1 hypothetical protein [Photorhabdus aballayi]